MVLTLKLGKGIICRFFFRCRSSLLSELPKKAPPKTINKSLATWVCHPQTTSMVAAENTAVGSPKSQPERGGISPDSYSSSVLRKLVKLSRIHFCLLQPVVLHALLQDIFILWEEIKVTPNKTESKLQGGFSSKCSWVKSNFFTLFSPFSH